ncbi:hypothetical protein N7490_010029 [Penicillium lividum]|nr:hypothetical protein N7490_010029 [Penicillium lividum]
MEEYARFSTLLALWSPSTAIERITQRIDGENTQMLNYFYCLNDDRSQRPVSIMLTFLHQLLAQLPLGFNTIEEKYEKWAFRGLDHESIQFDEAWSLFCAATGQYKRVYLIIDGLEEIEPHERGRFLDAISRLFAKGPSQYKLLISSRDSPEISHFQRYHHLKIRPSDNEDDIRNLVRTRIEKNSQMSLLGRDMSSETKEYLLHFLVQRSRGMILWVHLQLDELCHATTDNEMVSLIDKFPTDLKSLYRSLWDRVNRQRGSSRILACAVLELLTFTQYPIRLNCMKRVIEQKTRSASLYADDIDLTLIIRVCHSMVAYDERLDTLHFVHTTARHYLAKRLDAQLAHAWLAEICLQELLRFASTSSSTSDYANIEASNASGVDVAVNFTLYAAMSWHYHSRNCTQTPNYKNTELAFLSHATAPGVWIRILNSADGVRSSRLRTLLGFLRAYPKTMDSLFLVACFFDLDGIVTTSLASGEITTGENITIPSWEYIRTCISWAGRFSSTFPWQTREEIIAKYVGMTIRRSDFLTSHWSRTPFELALLLGDVRCAGAICAAEQGHENILKRILDILMRVDSTSVHFRRLTDSCRCLASAGNHFSVLETLGATDRIFKLEGTSPFGFLEESSQVGLSAFLGNREMLLYWKTKLADYHEYHQSKDLSGAVARNDERATKLLLQNFPIDIHHSRVCAYSGLVPSNAPLMTAAIMGHHRVIKVILRHPELDVNFQTKSGDTALMQAYSGSALAALCKHKHLNIHLRNRLGETALDLFVKMGHASGIKELAKHLDFNANQRNRWRETPLITAVRMRQVEVVRVLLRVPSIDVKACDEDGLSALEIANRLDHEPLRKMLTTRTETTKGDFVELEDLSVALIRI